MTMPIRQNGHIHKVCQIPAAKTSKGPFGMPDAALFMEQIGSFKCEKPTCRFCWPAVDFFDVYNQRILIYEKTAQ